MFIYHDQSMQVSYALFKKKQGEISNNISKDFFASLRFLAFLFD